MGSFSEQISFDRLGFHYFPDTVHYREQDLQTWLPRLKMLGASWIVLLAPVERAIPEAFIAGLLEAKIQPILHFQPPLGQPIHNEDLRLLFTNYSRWGVKYVALFDRPNSRVSWHPAVWAQTDLVERFLDLFLPLAETALVEGLTPVFPPLEPGGDYWDLAFLKTALRGIQRRGHKRLMEKLVLSACAWIGDRPLDWGAGGPDRWPGARPYHTPEGMQDHLGFRIFEWYLAVAEQELGRQLSLIILRSGHNPVTSYPGNVKEVDGGSQKPDAEHLLEVFSITRLLMGEAEEEQSPPLPTGVLAGNIWLLATEAGSPFAAQAWFQSGEESSELFDGARRFIIKHARARQSPVSTGTDLGKDSLLLEKVQGFGKESNHPIAHYVLLPLYSWGVAEWDLKAIQPLVQQSHPTIGFSLTEARLAERVTVIGGPGAISEDALDYLRRSGCAVERIIDDGMLIAS